LSERVNAPTECRDLARLAAQLGDRVERAAQLSAPALLDLLLGTDAMRRPERLEGLVRVCAAWRLAKRSESVGDDAPAAELIEALAIVRSVEAGKLATAGSGGRDVARRVRAARLKALRQWKAARAGR